MNETLVRAVLAEYVLPWNGIHGLRHWGRVLENGQRLAERTGADGDVVELFALFHDSRRVNEGSDPGHGLRGGDFARTLWERGLFDLSEEQFDLLHHACELHTAGQVDGDVTVQTCWDADRLDLARVWIIPDPRFLCTEAAKDEGVLSWAIERSRSNHQVTAVGTWLEWLSRGP
ncbi:MAG: hypothetical protein OEU54_05500 [Gemmatimonadota bacterium]|nr:hypothetical protein [Gemmatimonadota bacterium]